jgi:glycosyltransferase involved in cell wall biosynthesis
VRLLLITIFHGGIRDLHALSAMNGVVDLARGLVRAYDDVFCYVLLPERWPGGWSYRDDLLPAERCAPLVYRPLERRPDSQLPRLYDQIWLDEGLWPELCPVTGAGFYCDVLLNSRLEQTTLLQSLLRGPRALGERLTTINFEQDMTWVAQARGEVQRRHVFQLACGWPMFTYESEVALAAPMFKKHLSKAEVARCLEPPIAVPMAIDFGRCDAARRALGPRRWHDPPRLFYGGQLVPKKRVWESLDMLQPLWTVGRVGRYVLTTQTNDADQVTRLRARPDVELHGPPSPREQFLRLTYEADVFHCLSEHEGFGTGYFEMLMMGLVGVFLKAPWLKGNLPDDYPFLVDELEQVPEATRWVLAHLEEADRKVRPAREWIRRRFAAEHTARRFREHADRAIVADGGGQAPDPHPVAEALVGRWLRERGEPQTVPLPEAAPLIRRLGRRRVLDALAAYGYADDWQTAVPRLRRTACP